MLELRFGEPTPNNPTIRMRWCMSRGDFTYLRNCRAENLHLLIIVAYENGAEDRHLVPLDDLMMFLTFRYPGNHTVFTKVVWHRDKKALYHKLVKGRLPGRYELELLNRERTALRRFTDLEVYGGTLDQQVDGSPEESEVIMVAREFFATKPPEWVWRWVNLWFNDGPYDQCALRRRTILAFTLQPIVVGVYLAIRFALQALAIICLFAAGMRGLKPLVIFHPWKNSTDDFWQKPLLVHREYDWSQVYRNSSWFLEFSDGHWRPWYQAALLIIAHPLLVLAYWKIIDLFSRKYHLSYLQVLMHGLQLLGSILLGIALKIIHTPLILATFLALFTILLLLSLWPRINKKLATREMEAAREQQEREAQPDYQAQLALKEQRYYDELYRAMACTRTPALATLDTLPKEKRTIKLRFYDIKAQVCKPFAG